MQTPARCHSRLRRRHAHPRASEARGKGQCCCVDPVSWLSTKVTELSGHQPIMPLALPAPSRRRSNSWCFTASCEREGCGKQGRGGGGRVGMLCREQRGRGRAARLAVVGERRLQRRRRASGPCSPWPAPSSPTCSWPFATKSNTPQRASRIQLRMRWRASSCWQRRGQAAGGGGSSAAGGHARRSVEAGPPALPVALKHPKRCRAHLAVL